MEEFTLNEEAAIADKARGYDDAVIQMFADTCEQNAKDTDDLMQSAAESEAKAVEEGHLPEELLQEAHEDVVSAVNISAKGVGTITLEGDRAKAAIRERFGEDSFWYQSLPEDTKGLKAKFKVDFEGVIHDFDITVAAERKTFFDKAKGAVDHFVHNFAKDKDKERRSLFSKVSDGLAVFAEKTKEGIAQMYEKTGELYKGAKKAIEEDIGKSIVLKEIIEENEKVTAYIKEYREKGYSFFDAYMLAGRKYDEEALKNFAETMRDVTKEMLSPAISFSKEALAKAVSLAGQKAKQVSDAVKDGVSSVTDKAGEIKASFDERITRYKESAQRNFEKLADGASKRWSQTKAAGRNITEIASMQVASVKMAEAFTKEAKSIKKEYDKELKEHLLQIHKDKAEIVKDLRTELKEFKAETKANVKELHDKLEGINLMISGMKLMGGKEDEIAKLEQSKADLEEQIKGVKEAYKEDVQDYKAEVKKVEQAGKNTEKLEKQENNAERKAKILEAAKVLSERNEKVKIDRVAERDVMKDDAFKVSSKDKVSPKEDAREDARFEELKKEPSKSAANLLEVVEKNDLGRVESDAHKSIAHITEDRDRKIDEKEEANKAGRKWDKVKAALAFGLLNKAVHEAFPDGFKKENAEEITKAASEVRQASATAMDLDFLAPKNEKEEAIYKIEAALENLDKKTHSIELSKQALQIAKEQNIEKFISAQNLPRDQAAIGRFEMEAANVIKNLDELSQNDLVKDADIVCTADNKIVGIYTAYDDAPKSNAIKEMLDYAKGRGISDEALDAVLKTAQQMEDPNFKDAKVRVQIMKEELSGKEVLCVTRDTGSRAVSFMFDDKGNDIGIIRTKNDAENVLLASELACGYDRDGKAFYDNATMPNIEGIVQKAGKGGFANKIGLETDKSADTKEAGLEDQIRF